MDSEPPARLTYAVARLERLIRLELEGIVRRFGLTVPQYTTMSVLARRSGLSGAQLARRAFVSPQAVSVIIRDLSGAGLIARSPSKDHGRILTTALTAEGRRRLRACDKAVDVLELRLTDVATATDVVRVRSALDVWSERLAADLGADIPPTANARGRTGG